MYITVITVIYMIFTNNLKIDKNIKIPSNNNEYFIFEKHWIYAQKIIFDIDTVDIDNLYVIIQSYLWNSNLRSLRLYTFMKNDEEKILSYTNIFKVKKMNFFFFSNWWENLSNYDKQYLNEKSIYGIIIVFSQTSFISYCNNNNVNENDLYYILKPNYPWNTGIKNILNSFK